MLPIDEYLKPVITESKKGHTLDGRDQLCSEWAAWPSRCEGEMTFNPLVQNRHSIGIGYIDGELTFCGFC